VKKSSDFFEIDLKKLVMKRNSRILYKESETNSLMLMMKQQGQLQPIEVRPSGENYEVVFGNRRTLCARLLGWKTITARVLDQDDESYWERNYSENNFRSDLTIAEKGHRFEELLKVENSTIETIAIRFGHSRTYIETILSCYREIPKDISKSVREFPPGRSRKNNFIPLQFAIAIKRTHLSNPIKERLYQMSKREDFTQDRLLSSISRAQKGMPIEEALKKSTNQITVRINLSVSKSKLKALGGKKQFITDSVNLINNKFKIREQL